MEGCGLCRSLGYLETVDTDCEPQTATGCLITQLENRLNLKATSKLGAAKHHWSELRSKQDAVLDKQREYNAKTNRTVFDSLRLQEQDPSHMEMKTQFQRSLTVHQCAGVERNFYESWSSDWELGKEIAEGGQAKIYEETSKLYGGVDTVLKVFKLEGATLADLKKHWPPRLHMIPGELQTFICWLSKATLLPDGRFAFRLPRQWGDLRQLIDLSMSIHRRKGTDKEGKPFTQRVAHRIMKDIAMGMFRLHDLGCLHRDLKAANVLIISKRHNK